MGYIMKDGIKYGGTENQESMAAIQHNVTLASGFTLASWGSLTANSIGKMLIISGLGIKKSSVTSGQSLLATVDGVQIKAFTATIGFCEDSSNSNFLLTASASGNANEIKVEFVKTANSNLYFEMIIPIL